MLKSEIFKVGYLKKELYKAEYFYHYLQTDWWLEIKSAKEVRTVFYADNVKILCLTYSIARNMLEKDIKCLNKRLSLEVSEEKTKIISLKRNYSYFLEFKFKNKIHKKKIKQ